MNNKILKEYTSDFFVLRTPTLSLDTLYKFHQKNLSQIGSEIAFREIKSVFSQETMQEAIFIASPVLYQEMLKLLSAKSYDKGYDRAVLSLYQYLNRMSSRSTPFGLFAGGNLGTIGDGQTELVNLAMSENKKHLRLDMDFLAKLANNIFKSTPKDIFSYHSNSSCYLLGKKLRYIETTYTPTGKFYAIASVDYNDLLKALLKFCAIGKSYGDIIMFIMELGVPDTHARLYLDELIDGQLLLHEMHPNATGAEYMFKLQELLSNKPVLANVHRALSAAIEEFGSHDGLVERLEKIKKILLEISPDLNEAQLFQLDLQKSAKHCYLNHDLVDQVKEACLITAQLNPIDHRKSRLGQFKVAFEKRYETAMVKLTEVLDAENGIDYNDFKSTSDELDNHFLGRNKNAGFKLDKYRETLKTNSMEVVIYPVDVVNHSPISFPDSFSAFISLVKGNVTSSEHEIRFKFATGPSSANLIGRFSYMDSLFENKVRELVKMEESLAPDKVFAEIAHVPQDRVGNVIARPHLTDREIQFLSMTDISERNRILIDDLFLQLIGGRLVLFSKKLKVEVVPRLSNAHNFSQNNLQVYHFLCDLKSQDLAHSISWNWDFLSEQEFLPRVRYKNTILSPCIWNLREDHLAFFRKGTTDPKRGLSLLREKLKIPDLVMFASGDNELLLDLRLDMSFRVLQKAYNKQGRIKLFEPTTTLDNAMVRDVDGLAYANEIVIPLTRNTSSPYSSNSSIKPRFAKSDRIFPVGSEWAYFEIHTGVSTADKIIREVLGGFAAKMYKRKLIDKWFFIRYANPDFHLRVRFHVSDKVAFGEVVGKFYSVLNPMLSSGEIYDFSMRQYKREIERYGEYTIDLSEDLFCINSRYTALFLASDYQKQKDGRIFFAVAVIDEFLSAFGLDAGNRLSFYKDNRKRLAEYFQVDRNKGLKESLISLSRANKNTVRQIVTDRIFWNEYPDVLGLIENQTRDVVPFANEIQRILAINGSVSLTSLLSSYIHMFMNRLMAHDANTNELLAYEYLERELKSRIARSL